MQGEYRGDFTRDTYTPQKQFLRVLMQQGRVQLDADFNEQVSILLHYLQTLATDLIGPHGGPANNAGFAIAPVLDNSQLENLVISEGRYYVEGLLCENTQNNASYEHQPYLSIHGEYEYPKLPFLVYLDIWERHIDSIQDADSTQSSIRESALNGVDTAARSQVIWQVKLTQQLAQPEGNESNILQDILDLEKEANQPTEISDSAGEQPESTTAETDDSLLAKLKEAANILRTNPKALYLTSPDIVAPSELATLKAKVKESSSSDDKDLCIISPSARYRGAENQLYRVEIHSSGDQPTFKWSRENSAVIFPIIFTSDKTITLEHLGYDSRFGLKEHDWVEIVDDDYTYRNQPQKLLQIQKIDLVTQQVTLNEAPFGNTGRDPSKHPYLRRWDHQAGNPNYGGSELVDGAIPILIAKNNHSEIWQLIEDGIQIQFQPGIYRPGDYWLIPARTATGDIEWPREKASRNALAIPPHGIKHYYAPLAIIATDENGMIQPFDCRQVFTSRLV